MAIPFHRATQPELTQVLWRYMDFWKYVSMLARRALFFPRIGMFEDPFEAFEHWSEPIARKNLESRFDGQSSIPSSQLVTVSLDTGQMIRSVVYVNCWHANEWESAAMWKLYAENQDSVAVRTTYDLILKYVGNEKHAVGNVTYTAFGKEPPYEFGHTLLPCFYKRKEFEHERELRVVMSDVDQLHVIGEESSNRIEPKGAEELERGKWVGANLEKLISSVITSPYSDRGFVDLVRETTNQFGFEFQISRSPLLDKPQQSGLGSLLGVAVPTNERWS